MLWMPWHQGINPKRGPLLCGFLVSAHRDAPMCQNVHMCCIFHTLMVFNGLFFPPLFKPRCFATPLSFQTPGWSICPSFIYLFIFATRRESHKQLATNAIRHQPPVCLALARCNLLTWSMCTRWVLCPISFYGQVLRYRCVAEQGLKGRGRKEEVMRCGDSEEGNERTDRHGWNTSGRYKQAHDMV